MNIKTRHIKYVIPADKYAWSIFARGYDVYVGQQWEKGLLFKVIAEMRMLARILLESVPKPTKVHERD
jgi:hypothetical protein